MRRLARILIKEYEKAIDKAVERLYTRTSVVNSMENPREPSGEWWARGDLNPGPPPCQGGVLTRLDDGPTRSGLTLSGRVKGFTGPLRPSYVAVSYGSVFGPRLVWCSG